MRLHPDSVSFETVCNFMELLQQWSLKTDKKRKCIEMFIKHVVDRASGDAFSIFRLVLPAQDKERGNYRLKEVNLAKLFVKAIGWEATDPRAQGLVQYRDPGHDAETVGRLSLIIEKVGREYACSIKDSAPADIKKRLKVGDVNRKLDELVAGSDADAKAAAIRYFLENATPRNLKWLVQIILKSTRHGTGEAIILGVWHTEAKELFNARGQDLRAVFNTMIDPERSYTSKVQLLQLGKCARPQLASKVFSAAEALKKISGAKTAAVPEEADKPFVIETKFDGERIQVHRNGNVINYFSRRSIDHSETSSYSEMDAVIIEATKDHTQVMLDGEMVAWNRKKKVMVPFGVLKRVFNAVRDGAARSTVIISEEDLYYQDDGTEAPETQAGGGNGNGDADDAPSPITHRLEDIELMYIAFDLLYDAAERGSVIDRPLGDRRTLLAAVIPTDTSIAVPPPNPCGVVMRVLPLIPNQTTLYPGGPLLSWTGSTIEDVDEAVRAAQARREEGVILKRLDSPWSFNDRYSCSWLKIKPDYAKKFDIDALIVGGFYGEGDRGGQVGQYVLALRSDPPPGETPLPGGLWFKTFVKVGTGLSDEERKQLHERLEKVVGLQSGGPPHGVTACSKCEVWVTDPLKSVVLSVKSDIRLISTAMYATDLSLRFPIITGIRMKDPVDVDVAERLQEEVRAQLQANAAAGLSGKRRGGGGRREKVGGLVSWMGEEAAALEATEVQSDALAGKVVYVRKTGDDRRLAVRRIVTAAGGTDLPSSSAMADYVVSFEPLTPNELRAFTEKKGDGSLRVPIVTPEWVMACLATGALVPLRPRHLWHMGPQERVPTSQVDRYGAPYFARPTGADLEAMVTRHMAGAPLPGVLDLLQALRATPAARRNGKPSPRAAVIGPAAIEALNEAAKEAGRLQRRGTAPGPRLLLPWLDAELEARGKLDRGGAVLHGCTLLLLEIPTADEAPAKADSAPAAPAAQDQPMMMWAATAGTLAAESAQKKATEAARRLRFSRLRIQARLLGAAVVEEMSPLVTHLVGVTPAFLDGKSPLKDALDGLDGASSQAPSPAALLRAVSERGGGARGVTALRTALAANEVTLVDAEWIQQTASVANAAAAAVRYLEGRSEDGNGDGGGGGGGGGGGAGGSGGGGGGDGGEAGPSKGPGPSSGQPPAPPPPSSPLAQASALEPAADVSIERPDPSNYPLMDSAAMGAINSWPWVEHGAPAVPIGAHGAAVHGDEEMAAPPRRDRRRGKALLNSKRRRESPTPSPVVAPAVVPAVAARGQGQGMDAAPSLPEDVKIEEKADEVPRKVQSRRRGRAVQGGGRTMPSAALYQPAAASLASQPPASGVYLLQGGVASAPTAKAPRLGTAAAPGAALQSQPAAAPSQRPIYGSFADLVDPKPSSPAAATAGGSGAGPSTGAAAGSAPAPSQPSALGSLGASQHLTGLSLPPAGGGGRTYGVYGAVPPKRMTLVEKMALDKKRREEREQNK